jgi:hypothetical protein
LGGTNLDTLSHGDVLHKRIHILPLVGGSVLGRSTIAALLLEPFNEGYKEPLYDPFNDPSIENYSILLPSGWRMPSGPVFKRVGLLLIDEAERDFLWRWGLTPNWRVESKQDIVII